MCATICTRASSCSTHRRRRDCRWYRSVFGCSRSFVCCVVMRVSNAMTMLCESSIGTLVLANLTWETSVSVYRSPTIRAAGLSSTTPLVNSLVEVEFASPLLRPCSLVDDFSIRYGVAGRVTCHTVVTLVSYGTSRHSGSGLPCVRASQSLYLR